MGEKEKEVRVRGIGWDVWSFASGGKK